MNIKKKVLSVNDIKVIAGTINGMDSFMDAEVAKYCLIVQTCTDFELDFNDLGEIMNPYEIYEDMYKDGTINVLKKEILNIEFIEKECDRMNDMNRNISSFIKNIDRMANNFDADKLSSFVEMQEKLAKKSNNIKKKELARKVVTAQEKANKRKNEQH